MKMVGFRVVPNSLIILVIVLLLRFRGSTLVVVGQTQQQVVTVLPERFALIQLRSGLGIRARDWPIKSDPCSVWKGIQCVNGSVVGVNVSGFRRTRIGGQNPQFSVDPLANLTQLASFNASGFVLPGQIPDLFGQSLGNLQVLDLGSCNIKGTIPFSLGNLTRLSVLVLSHNNISGIVPAALGQLVNLSTLDLSHNQLTGSIPDSVSSLKNISVFDLSGNFLSGPIPPGIGMLSSLRTLNFSNNMLISDIPPQLGDLKALVDLDLSVNSLTSVLPPDLRGLRSLRKLVIGNNLFSGELPAGLFPGLTQLQVVVLSHNNFSGKVPDALWTMPTLQLVDVSGNNFTGMLPNVSFNANATSSVQVLNLSNNKYYGGLSMVLQRFNLIDVSGNYFEGKIPDILNVSTSFTDNCLQNATNQRTREECASFYASKGLVFDNFGIPKTNVTPTAGNVPGKSNRRRNILLAAILGGVGVLLLLFLVLFLILCARRNGGTNQRSIGVDPTPAAGAGPTSPGVTINFSSLGDKFTQQQLLLAAGNFNDANLIKNGHSGDLFRGVLEGGIPVVIKRINSNSAKREAYLVELDFFSKVSHPRFVPLLGYCLDQENPEKYLVYKHMPNSDLSSSLFRKINADDDNLQSLDWITRLKIAIGAAEGLAYLHHECDPPYVHRDVQASSILLDDKFEVRLGSLGEVRVQEGDTQPGVITRLFRTSEEGPSGSQTSTSAYDVYCFGKVLLELVTGKLGVSASNDASMKEWLEQTLSYINIYDKELVTKIVDPTLIYDEDLLEEVWAMAIVARSCLNPRPSRRPLMRYILKALENPLKVVREENTGSARLRTTSSRESWNTSVFGSWRQSLEVGPATATSAPLMETAGSLGSGRIVGGADNAAPQGQ
ncbi:putative LRR receptor-like serine/threonine-protein kinase At2g16250 isoform X2 [Silene latifolia]|uniref:putative LRR receptor-like serine/threonine-protein kinase At2g16250 isoform X2 n=1 Tax=Silene latifolia TaxID=37657 RepID=UPI003D788DA2